MGLNNEENFINQLTNMSDKQLESLDLDVYLVSIGKESDELYFAKKEKLDPKLREWIKKRIKKELAKLKIEGDDQKRFYVSDYSHELTKPDYIAQLKFEDDYQLNVKIQKLYKSLSNNNSEFLDKDAKFQLIRIKQDSDEVCFIYYRGVKTSAVEKKDANKMPTIRNREELVMQNKDVIEFGGKIELFIHKNRMYITNPRTLEYAFMYNDHIKNQRDQNIAKIINMNFFDSDSKTEQFVERSSQYILSRGLASIKNETLEALEDSFEKRCLELKEIKENIPNETNEREKYLDRYKSLWPLFNHIDIYNKKVRFDPEKKVTPLLHFFSDKIVESFLTKKIKSSTY